MIGFVIGLERSGTNLLGGILGKHPDILCDAVTQPQLNMVIRTLVYSKPITPLISLYRSKQYGAIGRVYIAKEQPNIWLVEQLRCLNGKFICIERDPYQVVASSLLDNAVLTWIKDDYPSNPLSANYLPEYEELNTIERLTLRWIINHKRIIQLSENNPGDILFINYADLFINPTTVLFDIQSFLKLDMPFTLPHMDMQQLTLYQQQLSLAEQDTIYETLSRYS